MFDIEFLCEAEIASNEEEEKEALEMIRSHAKLVMVVGFFSGLRAYHEEAQYFTRTFNPWLRRSLSFAQPDQAIISASPKHTTLPVVAHLKKEPNPGQKTYYTKQCKPPSVG